MKERTVQRLIFLQIFFVHFLIEISECYRFEPNTLTVTNISFCHINETNRFAHLEQNLTHIWRNKYNVSGEMVIKEFISAPIQVTSLRNLL